MKKDYVDFICSLYGYLIRTKEIHWNTNSNTEHLRCDEIEDFIKNSMDTIAECMMGIEDKKFKIGDLKPMLPNSNTIVTMLKELEKEIIDFEDSLDGTKNNGLKSILDELLANVDKYKYRATQE